MNMIHYSSPAHMAKAKIKHGSCIYSYLLFTS